MELSTIIFMMILRRSSSNIHALRKIELNLFEKLLKMEKEERTEQT